MLFIRARGKEFEVLLGGEVIALTQTRKRAEKIINLIDNALSYAHDEGRMEGYENGHDDGRMEGYDEGYKEGRIDGYNQGHSDAIDEAETNAG